jgi:protein-S-isoprenylcysteine O-methyltransferase Ste14
LSVLELKIPPVATTIGFALLMWLLSRLAPGLGPAAGWRLAAAGGIAIAGGLVGLAAVRAFRIERTTVNPLRPHDAAKLVQTGIFGISRNPMYLGLLIALAGWALYLGSVLSLLLLLGYVPWMNRVQIIPEERALERAYGEDFAAYRQAVRRWL